MINNIRISLNKYFSFIDPPKSSEHKKVLIVTAHPISDSFCIALSRSCYRGLKAAGHEIRLRNLYNITSDISSSYNNAAFAPALTAEERSNYHESHISNQRETQSGIQTLHIAPEVKEAIQDIRWADSIVFIYPTW